ncbi:hypothetical protein [Arthrobacter crystallopoietes]|uniref:hypothetical protein n=1 Tax=Crystallibacter crystallopoietes TaxID=37928 RepID=UPI0011113FC5|nr:hypothetical protein [Arthrobacter crystallopoietes]QTG81956.1 hypothetical protein J5251_05045 [Arthrobacter crystallopoietes]
MGTALFSFGRAGLFLAKAAVIFTAAVVGLTACTAFPQSPSETSARLTSPGVGEPDSSLETETGQPPSSAFGSGTSGDGETGLRAGETPPDNPDSSSSGPDDSAPSKDPGKWGSYGTRTEACTAVAAKVAVLMLAPLSFIAGVDEARLDELQAEVEDLRDKAPAELHDELDDVEAELAKHEDLTDFDDESFREAVEPIQEWLKSNCTF